MTKLRFYAASVFIFLILVGAIIASGNSLVLYVDIASLILSILIPYIIISFLYTPKEQMQFKKEIFTPIGTGNKKELERALDYFKSFKSLLIYTAIVATILGLIAMMANLQDPESLGPNFAVLLIVPLYVSMFMLLVTEPLRAAAEKNLKG